MERVANFLVGLLGDGSADTVMKIMRGSLQLVQSSRGKGFEGSEESTVVRVWPKVQAKLFVILSQGASVLSFSARSRIFSFQKLSWFVSGTGNDLEVARARLVGCSRRHSRVPCCGGRWLRVRLTQSGRPHIDVLQFSAGKPCSVRINGCALVLRPHLFALFAAHLFCLVWRDREVVFRLEFLISDLLADVASVRAVAPLALSTVLSRFLMSRSVCSLPLCLFISTIFTGSYPIGCVKVRLRERERKRERKREKERKREREKRKREREKEKEKERERKREREREREREKERKRERERERVWFGEHLMNPTLCVKILWCVVTSLMEPCRYDMGCWRPLCPYGHSGRRAATWAALWRFLADMEDEASSRSSSRSTSRSVSEHG